MSNDLCTTSDWVAVQGTSTSGSSCSQALTSRVCGDRLWFGSSDGNTYDSDYSFYSFTLETTISIQSGDHADIMFRTISLGSDICQSGQTYLYGFSVGSAFLGKIDGAYSHIDTYSMSLSYNTEYTLKIVAVGTNYNFYFDGTLIFSDVELTDFVQGSMGVRFYNALATLHSIEMTPYVVGMVFVFFVTSFSKKRLELVLCIVCAFDAVRVLILSRLVTLSLLFRSRVFLLIKICGIFTYVWSETIKLCVHRV